MDPKQVRAEMTAMKLDKMRATRERIDLKLDLIQARAAASKGPAGRIAFGAAALGSVLGFLAKRRGRR